MDLPHSKLGTKDYWDQFYNTEIKNFEDNSADTGERWFDDSGAEDRMVQYVEDDLQLSDDCNVLDLGTGNGHLLFALREAGVSGQLLGIDYSLSSVEFAKKLAAAKSHENVSFQQVDFVNDPDWTQEKFDLILDKGTLDAIALSGVSDAPKKYVKSVLPRLKDGGSFMITSCNFTKNELCSLIDRPYDEIEYPSFSFGGSKGSTVVTLIFH